jgi:ribosome biogenesis protein NSA2
MEETPREKGMTILNVRCQAHSTNEHKLDHEERTRKRVAREGHKASDDAQKLTGLRAKLYQKKRHHEKIQMKKQIKAHEERNVKSSAPAEPSTTPLPQYLLDRSNPTNAKALSSASTSTLAWW